MRPFHELLKSSFNLLIDESFKCTEERIEARANSFLPSNKQLYFTEHMMHALKSLFEKALRDFKRSAFAAGFSSAVQGAFRAALLQVLLPKGAEGVAQGANVAATVTHTAYEVHGVQDAQFRAAKIIKFFGLIAEDSNDAKFDDGFVSNLVFLLWFEFRLHIELMEKGNEGCDVFTDFLILRIKAAIEKSDRENFSQDSRAEQLKFLRMQIYSDPDSMPNTEIAVRGQKLGWRIDECFWDSPIVLIESLTTSQNPHPICQMSIYRQVTRTKSRAIVSEISAEGSHKYPPRFLMTASDAALMPGYEKLPHFKRGKGLHISIENKLGYLYNNQDAIDQLSQIYGEMLACLRPYARKKDREYFAPGIVKFMQAVKILLQHSENLSIHGWLLTASELIGLYNIYDRFIKNVIENIELQTASPSMREAFQLVSECAGYCLSVFHVTDEIVNVQERRILLDQTLLKRIDEIGLSILDDEQKREFQEKIKRSRPTLSNATRVFVPIAQDQSNFFLKADEITKFSENIKYAGTDGKNYMGCVLEKGECDYYNEQIMLYFRVKNSMEDADRAKAFESIVGAMIPFAVTLNDVVAFGRCDIPLINRILYLGHALRKEFIVTFKNLPEEFKASNVNLMLMGLQINKCLKETLEIFKNCKLIAEKPEGVAEKFSALETEYKILIGFGVVVAVIVAANAARSALGKSSSDSKPADSTPANPPAPDNSAAAVKTLFGYGRLGVSVVGGLIGAFGFGLWVVSAEAYAQHTIKRRVHALLAQECANSLQGALANRKLWRLFPLTESLQSEVERFVNLSDALIKERELVQKNSDNADNSQASMHF